MHVIDIECDRDVIRVSKDYTLTVDRVKSNSLINERAYNGICRIWCLND